MRDPLHIPRIPKPGMSPALLWVGVGVACFWVVVIWACTR